MVKIDFASAVIMSLWYLCARVATQLPNPDQPDDSTTSIIQVRIQQFRSRQATIFLPINAGIGAAAQSVASVSLGG